MKPFPAIKVDFNGHKPTHKIKIKGPMGTGLRNPMRITHRLKNPVR